LPSKGAFRPITPELIETSAMLAHYGISREQLIDLAMLVGTDFNEGVKGIGPKKALKLVSEFGSIDSMPAEVQNAVGPSVQEIREIFLKPDVTDEYEVRFGAPDIDAIVRFLCEEREFSRERVIAALDRTFGQPRLGTADDGF
jgi:flap endonuclease-1